MEPYYCPPGQSAVVQSPFIATSALVQSPLVATSASQVQRQGFTMLARLVLNS
ncbi:hypothetical protein AAY473_013609 [Plecturocebus cupreus]